MVGDVQRLQENLTDVALFGPVKMYASLWPQDEVKRHFAQQKAENARAACK